MNKRSIFIFSTGAQLPSPIQVYHNKNYGSRPTGCGDIGTKIFAVLIGKFIRVCSPRQLKGK